MDDLDIETTLTGVGGAWLLAVIVFSVFAVIRMYRNGRDRVNRPRLEALEWLSSWASLIGTAAALVFVATHLFRNAAEENGLISSIVIFALFGLGLYFAPNWGQERADRE